MPYVRRSRRRRRRRSLYATLAVSILVAGVWWFWGPGPESETDGSTVVTGAKEGSVRLAQGADRDAAQSGDALLVAHAEPEAAKKSETASNAEPAPEALWKPPDPPVTVSTAPPGATEIPAIATARRLVEEKKFLEARGELTRLLSRELTADEHREVCRLLTRVADETIFSKRRIADDPLVEWYAVQGGEVLVKIGKRFGVPAEAIMLINGIKDPRRIQENQRIKIPRGPFNVRIYKSQFRLEVYLQGVFMRSFPVGLGQDPGTPEGGWVVKERLPDPTYYPPASAERKRIIPPDDPKNPLGERWIGLKGESGDAVGQNGFGIHGTIEPTSIGKAVSLGCVRMHNKDVEFLYKLVLDRQSKVTILP